MANTTTLSGILSASGASSPEDLKGSTPASYNRTDLQSAKAALEAGVSYENLTQQQKNAIDAEYNFATSLILSDPALMTLFTNATKNGWNENRFRLEAEQTDWFKNRTASQEWYDIIAAKGTAAKDLEEIRNTIYESVKSDAVSRLGIDLTNQENVDKINQVTDYILKNQYQALATNPSILTNLVSAQFKNLKASEFGGSIGKTMQSLTSSYRSLGMNLSEDAATKYAQSIMLGDTTFDTINANVRKDAAKMWSQFSDRINAGEDIPNILYPYRQLIGSMLEVDPESLDFTVDDPTKGVANQIDPLLQKALFSSADKTGVMSLTDLRKSIKSDSRWQYTKNAQEEYASMTSSLMRMFGAGGV